MLFAALLPVPINMADKIEIGGAQCWQIEEFFVGTTN